MGFDIGLWGAATAGLLSFLTPCILPIVPFYLCYLAGMSFDELTQEGAGTGAIRRKAVISSLFFAAGVTTIFVGLGWTASTFGQALREYMDVIRYVAAGIIALLGLHFLGVFRIAFLMREARIDAGDRKFGVFGAYLIGMAFAFGWTPCVGPALAAILFQAADAQSADQGVRLLLAYALGMTAPFVLAAAFIGPFMRWAAKFRRHLPKVEKAMGLLLIVFAVLIGANMMNEIAQLMLDYAPDLGLLQ
ncbi:cytochrome c biogenesis CcdA family protein [Rhodovulum sp. DZ06]|uniref:cytochrome c biogenesis CcdA family protein n=1 Tax=Rhodovulum sp. DZ06 TaxID=3425126 RepID=UPI003D356684